MDEFKDLKLEHTLEHTWKDALCFYGEGKVVSKEGRCFYLCFCGCCQKKASFGR